MLHFTIQPPALRTLGFGRSKPLPYERVAFAADGTGLGTSISAVTPSVGCADSSLKRELLAVPLGGGYNRLPRRRVAPPRNDSPRTQWRCRSFLGTVDCRVSAMQLLAMAHKLSRNESHRVSCAAAAKKRDCLKRDSPMIWFVCGVSGHAVFSRCRRKSRRRPVQPLRGRNRHTC